MNNDNYPVLIKDLVLGFLIPNIDKERLRKEIESNSDKFSTFINKKTINKYK